MLDDRERLEYQILAIIRDADRPVGCGGIALRLQADGQTISEATVGRQLRELDIAGYTEKSGYQGRILSLAGINRLEELGGKNRRLQWGAALLESLEGHSKEQLLEVLIARRAIEGELAYLAAQNATGEEIERGQAILDRQQAVMAKGAGAAEEDVEFHNLITTMARNRVLAAALALIRQDTQLSPVLEFIRLRVNSIIYVDHQLILDYITGRRPEEAKAAMAAHINNLIHDVEKYWELIEDNVAN